MTFEEFFAEWRNQAEFIKVKTSGSTGTPKEINLLKSFLRESAKRTIRFFNIADGSRFHSCVSPDFIGGKMMAVRADISNGHLTWEKPSNKPLLNVPQHEIIDLLAVVPSQMLHLIDNKDFLPKINNIIIGGSQISTPLRKKIAESGLNCYETYGMTETASHIALRKISSENLPFKTLPGIQVSADERDCLKINFENGFEIKTKDIAEILNPHEFFIKGRIDNIILSGGRKINPKEIEDKISSLISSPFIITGLEDEKWGQKVVLIIEDNGVGKLKFNKEVFRSLLDSWEIPKEIYFVDKLPRTENGKIISVADIGLCVGVRKMPI